MNTVLMPNSCYVYTPINYIVVMPIASPLLILDECIGATRLSGIYIK